MLNWALTIPRQQSHPESARPRRIGANAIEGDAEMNSEGSFAKTPATLDEIRTRVAWALERHPLCRNVQFDIISTPRSSRGGNWTIALRSVGPGAVWEASDIVADIQDAYELAA
jgi:hypothetical protein